MRTFGGEFARRQKVSLAGKSRQAETREDVLHRTRLERERRHRLKEETRAATRIQSAWRSLSTRRAAKDSMRSAWLIEYGQDGRLALQPSSASSTGDCLQQLCFFVDPRGKRDVALLASVCKRFIDPDVFPGLKMDVLVGRGEVLDGEGRNLTADEVHLAALRAQRLVALALDTLYYHREELKYALWKQRSCRRSEGYRDEFNATAVTFVEFVKALTSDAFWQRSGERQEPTQLSMYILSALAIYNPGLFEKLASIAVTACFVGDESLMSEALSAEERVGGSIPIGESLITHIIVRYFSLKLDTRIQDVDHRTPHSSASLSCPISMLFVPNLASCIPSLKPLMPRLWRVGIVNFDVLHFERMFRLILPAVWSRNSIMEGVLSLLGNLMQHAEEGLNYRKTAKSSIDDLQSQTTGHQSNNQKIDYDDIKHLGVSFVSISMVLLSYLPKGCLANSSVGATASTGAWMEDDSDSDFDYEDEEDSIFSGVRSSDICSRERNAVHPSSVSAMPIDGTDIVSHQVLVENLGRPLRLQSLRTCISSPSLLSEIINAVLSTATRDSSPDVSNTTLIRESTSAGRTLSNFLLLLMHVTGQHHDIMLTLALRTRFIARFWFSFLRPAHLSSIWEPRAHDDTLDPGWMLPLILFSEAFTAAIIVSGDQSLYERESILPLLELPLVLALLKNALWHILWVEAPPSPNGWGPPAMALRARISRSAGRLMAQLHERNGRKQFAPAEAFYADNLPSERFQVEVANGVAAGLDVEHPEGSRAWKVLRRAPFLVPFVERARVFQRMVSSERLQHRQEDPLAAALGRGHSFVTVRRGNALMDAYAALGNESPDVFKQRIRVAFVSELGTSEAGVDGGGIFKEFLEEVVKEGFDPSFGLFLASSDQRLYPNPHALESSLMAPQLLEFLGRLLGKALWEGILVELPLAGFFLKKFLRTGTCDIDDLPSLDPQLARSLLSLRDLSPSEVEALGLTFSATESVNGQIREIELLPGGKDIPVTSTNAVAFIHALSDFRLNRQLSGSTSAFLRGFHALIPRQWLSLFNAKELQELISGADGEAALDISDMQGNVQYAGGYSPDHPVIQAFWRALESFNGDQQRKFLRFVTSCPRPPLLGFAYLEPPLCIQMAGGMEEAQEGRLPTAATCMNLLKLPPYPGGVEHLKEKLLYSIESGAGFELS